MTPGDEKSARQWALKALGRRMHTAQEIRTSLSRRGFTSETAGRVVEEFERAGYIDDPDFARTWITSRSVNRLHGRLRILRDLRRKGIPEEMAQSALHELLPHEEEVVLAKRAAEKKRRIMEEAGRAAGARSREALYRHLKSRGFTTQVISAVLAGMAFEEDPS